MHRNVYANGVHIILFNQNFYLLSLVLFDFNTRACYFSIYLNNKVHWFSQWKSVDVWMRFKYMVFLVMFIYNIERKAIQIHLYPTPFGIEKTTTITTTITFNKFHRENFILKTESIANSCEHIWCGGQCQIVDIIH